MLTQLRDAEYKNATVTGIDDCNRYEIQFKDGIIPDELKRYADETDIAQENHLHFISYPDECLLAHLKVQFDGEMSIVLNALSVTNDVIASVEVDLSWAERTLVEDKMKADKTIERE